MGKIFASHVFIKELLTEIYKELILSKGQKKKKKKDEKMGKGSEQTFSQRHTDGQQVHEKMLNNTNHQGNENLNHNEILLHTCQNCYNQKDKK